MAEPKVILDLFCGEGGASMGLHQQWPNAKIIGVDLFPMPNYPFEFVQADWRDFLHSAPLDTYDFIWASPPCQKFSLTKNFHPEAAAKYPDFIQMVRDELAEYKGPWVIENVPPAPLVNPVRLCGTMFRQLNVYRHRLFEPHNFEVPQPSHPQHDKLNPIANTYNGNGGRVTVAGHMFSLEKGSEAMGIDWMTVHGLAESIPPVYSKYIASWVK